MAAPPNHFNVAQFVNGNNPHQQLIVPQLNAQQQAALINTTNIIDRLWRLHQGAINNGTKNYITVAAGHYNMIGEEGLKVISKRYRFVPQLSIPVYGVLTRLAI